MSFNPTDLRRLEETALTEDQRAVLRCERAKRMEEAGEFEAARGAMGDIWGRVGERPRLEGLGRRAAAEVLLRAGALSGWIGSARQIREAQEMAKDLISESLRTFETLGEPVKAAEARSDLAVCYWREAAHDEARILLEEALKNLPNDESELKAKILQRLGLVEWKASHHNEALRVLKDAAPLTEKIENNSVKGSFHNQLGNVLENLGAAENREDYLDQALMEYEAAAFYWEQAGNTRYRALAENNRGFLFYRTGKFAEAYRHLDRAQRLFSGLKDSRSVAQVNDTRAQALVAEGRYDEGERVARAAVCTLEQGDESSLLAEALTTHGTALARLGHYEQARAALLRAEEVARDAGDTEAAGVAALASLEALGGRMTAAEMREAYTRADGLLSDSQHPGTLARLRRAARLVISKERARDGKLEELAATEFVHASARAAELLRAAYRVAPLDGPVLISGETGTGKELLARMLHNWGGRAGRFVTVNCATLTDDSFESEIFGRAGGGAQDMTGSHVGAARRADGGTLFFDEITDLSESVQGKLLRLIEHGEVQTVGSPRPERVNTRVVAATRRDLAGETARGLLRDELFYRLNTFRLEIPPLRERPEDIPALAEHFARELAAKHGERVTFTPEAKEALRLLPLKGNARELRSLIEQTILSAPQGATVTRESVEACALRQTPAPNLVDAWEGFSLEQEVLIYERNIIRLALEAGRGSVTRAARLLGITHQGLAYILQGRHKDLMPARTPVQRRRRSIFK
ncbi:MAG TPA: sigma 54-interacting transcriptional regulator, partial [Pyrinomonadaceae bacterium]